MLSNYDSLIPVKVKKLKGGISHFELVENESLRIFLFDHLLAFAGALDLPAVWDDGCARPFLLSVIPCCG